MNGQPAVSRVDLERKREQENVIRIVMAFKRMTSKKYKVATMTSVKVNKNIDVWGTYQNINSSTFLIIRNPRLLN